MAASRRASLLALLAFMVVTINNRSVLGQKPQEPMVCFHCDQTEDCNRNLGRSESCKTIFDRCATFYDSTNSVKVTARGCDRRILSGCYRTGITTQACVCSFDHCNNFVIQDMSMSFTHDELVARTTNLLRRSAAGDAEVPDKKQLHMDGKNVQEEAYDPLTDMLSDTREQAAQMLAKSFLRYKLGEKRDPSLKVEKDVVVRRNVVKNLVTNYLKKNPTHDVDVVQLTNDDIHLHFYETVTPKPTVIDIKAVMEEAQNIVYPRDTSGTLTLNRQPKIVLLAILAAIFLN